MHHVACATCHFQAIHNVLAAQTDTSHIHEKSLAKASPNGSALAPYCQRLQSLVKMPQAEADGLAFVSVNHNAMESVL